ncbi:Oligosaccharide translocation protein rft1 [Entophlyctis luteolus]|nr:Oligosaccharide translocation protein rft1 [Entophlyctis luteolus]
MDFFASTGQLVLLNVWSRVLTFVLNQLALRYITRAVLGVVGVEMELVLSTVLFLSRESIRMALLREPPTLPPGQTALSRQQYRVHQAVVNAAWLPVPLGALAALGASMAMVRSGTGDSRLLFCAAAFVEILAEPLYVLAYNNLQVGLRVRVEGIAVFTKCVVTLVVLRFGSLTEAEKVTDSFGVLAFSCGQIAYAAILLAGYGAYFVRKYSVVSIQNTQSPRGISLLLPHKLRDDDGDSKRKLKEYYLEPKFKDLAFTFAKQGVFKHFLTEGDKILSVAFITEDIQGDYSLVEKYGMPLEEMGRIYFGKILSSTERPSLSAQLSALKLLNLLLRIYVLLSLFAVAIATNYTGLVIDVLATSTFSKGSAPAVLAAYCVYIPALAINGITEAFVQSVAPQDVLMRQSRWMVVCSLAFFAVGWTLIVAAPGFGLHVAPGVSLVVANLVNMCLRISFSWKVVRDYFVKHMGQLKNEETVKASDGREIERLLHFQSIFPRNAAVWAAFVVAWAVTFFANRVLGWESTLQKAQNVAVGGAATLAVFCVL